MNLLIVEDETTKYNDIVSAVKSKYDVQIQRAYNSKDALSLIRQNCFDLILLDMTLPVAKDNSNLNTMAGKELLFDMLTDEIEVPTIVVTRYSNFGASGSVQNQETDSLKYLVNELFGLDEEIENLDISFDITTFEGMHEYLKYNIPFYAGIVFYTQQNSFWKEYLIKIMERIK